MHVSEWNGDAAIPGLYVHQGEALIVGPIHESKRGHPVLFRREILEEFMELGDNETMKDVVNRHESRHIYVESDIWATVDLDTLEDLDRIRKLWVS